MKPITPKQLNDAVGRIARLKTGEDPYFVYLDLAVNEEDDRTLIVDYVFQNLQLWLLFGTDDG